MYVLFVNLTKTFCTAEKEILKKMLLERGKEGSRDLIKPKL
jgi:ribose 1,5-bisphosphokinase PhnN